ncbi:hypothetical protein B7494_g4741 [Chlorociboria aeruginascens]|nr:hypothetical protein B7494_g4741 [Chlorociboria aeruginascens]
MFIILFLTTSFYVNGIYGQAALYGQCGGQGWTGAITCVSGAVCTYSNAYYSQCLPGTNSGTAPGSSITVSSVLSSVVASTAPSSPTGTEYSDAVTVLMNNGRAAINTELVKSNTCSSSKLFVRNEWGNLSSSERLAYIAAVQCLLTAPSKLPASQISSQFPGVHSRYDDFVLTHMQQTVNIHGTVSSSIQLKESYHLNKLKGNFLSWHRYYTWSYEQALRNECGYNGTQPYWDWGRWASNPEASPIFDGSDTSMSGNGQKVSHQATFVGPAQNGGGCVQTGPFKNMTVYLGPISPAADPAPPANPQSNGFGSNPRCLRRDLGPYLTENYATTSIIANLITQNNDIGSFQTMMQGTSPMGVHSAAHFTIGSDPGGDFYTSPGDPAFFLLHAQIDRVWTIWQSQNLQNRMQVISGGTSMLGGGAAQQLTDVQSIPLLDPTGGSGFPISSLWEGWDTSIASVAIRLRLTKRGTFFNVMEEEKCSNTQFELLSNDLMESVPTLPSILKGLVARKSFKNGFLIVHLFHPNNPLLIRGAILLNHERGNQLGLNIAAFIQIHWNLPKSEIVTDDGVDIHIRSLTTTCVRGLPSNRFQFPTKSSSFNPNATRAVVNTAGRYQKPFDWAIGPFPTQSVIPPTRIIIQDVFRNRRRVIGGIRPPEPKEETKDLLQIAKK